MTAATNVQHSAESSDWFTPPEQQEWLGEAVVTIILRASCEKCGAERRERLALLLECDADNERLAVPAFRVPVLRGTQL